MNIIFHYPFPLPNKKSSGSKKRLIELSQAFQESNHQVEIVSGFASERKKAIERIKQQIRQGRQFDFMYSESSTIPSIYAKKNLLNPLLDYKFFQFCKKNNINIGLYYRDVHWKFPKIITNVPIFRKISSTPFYYLDWLIYLSTVDHLFLPSLSMKNELPTHWGKKNLSSLPPGCFIQDNNNNKVKDSGSSLRILYVGGVTPPLYNLTPLFEIINKLEEVSVVICCRKREWDLIKHFYDIGASKKISVVHRSGKDLSELYQSADVFSLLLQKNSYLNFAMPVKIFEAVGSGLPLICFGGTEMASFIQKNDVGWVVENVNDAVSLIRKMKQKNEIIHKKKENIFKIQDQHTWQARVDQIVETMIRI